MDEKLDKSAKNITPRFNRKTAREIVDEEQKRLDNKLQAIRDKYDALIKEYKEEDEAEEEWLDNLHAKVKAALRKRKTAAEIVEEDRKRFEKKLQAVRNKYEALIKEIEE